METATGTTAGTNASHPGGPCRSARRPRDSRTTFRPLAAGETGPLHRVFEQLSPTSVFLRYHSLLPRLTPTMARQLSAVAPGRHEAIVAERDGGAVGIARWVLDPTRPGAAEVAVEVADALHGLGIGGHLLRAVVDGARRAGMTEVTAYVHPENTLMTDWLCRLGAERPRGLGEPLRLRLDRIEVDNTTHACGCMTACGCRCSDPSGSGRTGARSRHHEERDREICLPSSSPDVVVPFPRRSPSTSSGEMRPPA